MGNVIATAITAALMLPSLPESLIAAPPHPAGKDPVEENAVLSAAVGVPVVLALAPSIVHGLSGSIDKAMKVASEPAMWAGVFNSAIWILFAFMSVEKEHCIELILGLPLMMTANFSQLLNVYGMKKSKWNTRKAVVLVGVVLSSLSYSVYASRFGSPLPESAEGFIGYLCVGCVFVSHGCLMRDISHCAKPVEFVVSIINVVPAGLLSYFTIIVIGRYHKEQIFVLLSALVGFFCFIVEMFLLFITFCEICCCGGPHDQAPFIPPQVLHPVFPRIAQGGNADVLPIHNLASQNNSQNSGPSANPNANALVNANAPESRVGVVVEHSYIDPACTSNNRFQSLCEILSESDPADSYVLNDPEDKVDAGSQKSYYSGKAEELDMLISTKQMAGDVKKEGPEMHTKSKSKMWYQSGRPKTGSSKSTSRDVPFVDVSQGGWWGCCRPRGRRALSSVPRGRRALSSA